MKKKILLPMASLAILGTIASASSLSLVKAEDGTSWSDETKTSFVNFFLSPLKMESDFKISYYGDDVIFHSEDQISSTRRHLKVTASSGELTQFIGETSIYADENDYAYSESISLANEVVGEALTDSSDNQVSYSTYYSPWFKLPSSYSVSNFSKYFEVASAESGYSVTLTGLGEGILLPRLISYLPQLDSFNYDTSSYKESIEDFVILTNSEGLPTSMSFRLVYSDRYGGTYQKYETTLTALDEVVGLVPYTPTSTSEEQAELDALLSELGEKVLTGNFTQHTEYLIEYTDTTTGNATQVASGISYNCYYELDSNPYQGGEHFPLMLCDFELESTEYGLTLCGIYYFADSSAYCRTGVSPEEDFIEPLDSATYTSIDAVTPGVQDISSDFYTKNSDGQFVFDLSSVDFDTYYFSYSLLEEVMGIGDYYGTYSGYFMSGSYAFDMDSLKVYKNSDGNFVTELKVTSQAVPYTGYYLVAKSVYSDFGTTSLEAVNNATIQDCLEVVKAYEATI